METPTPRKRPIRKALSVLLSILMVMGCVSAAFTVPSFANQAAIDLQDDPVVLQAIEDFKDAMDAAEVAGAFINPGGAGSAWTYSASHPGTAANAGTHSSTITDNTDGALILKVAQAYDALMDTNLVAYNAPINATNYMSVYPYTWGTMMYQVFAKQVLGYGPGAQRALMGIFNAMRTNNQNTLNETGNERLVGNDSGQFTSSGVGSVNNNGTGSTVTVTVNSSELRALRAYDNYDDIEALLADGGVVTNFVFGQNLSVKNNTGANRYNVFTSKRTPTYTRATANILKLQALKEHFFDDNDVGGAGQTNPFDRDVFNYATKDDIDQLVADNTAAWSAVTDAATSTTQFTKADIDQYFDAGTAQAVDDFIQDCKDAQKLIYAQPDVEYFMEDKGATSLIPGTPGFVEFIQSGGHLAWLSEPGATIASVLTKATALYAEATTHYDDIDALPQALFDEAVDWFGLEWTEVQDAMDELLHFREYAELTELKERIDADFADFKAWLDAYPGELPADYEEFDAWIEAYFMKEAKDPDGLKPYNPNAYSDDMLAAMESLFFGYLAALNSGYTQAQIDEVFTDGADYVEEFETYLLYEIFRRGIERGPGGEGPVRKSYAFFNSVGSEVTEAKSADDLIALVNKALGLKNDFLAQMEDEPYNTGMSENSFELMYTDFIPVINNGFDMIHAAMIGRLSGWVKDVLDHFDPNDPASFDYEITYENVWKLRKIFDEIAAGGKDIYDYLAANKLLDDDMAANLAAAMPLLLGPGGIVTDYLAFIEDDTLGKENDFAIDQHKQLIPDYPERLAADGASPPYADIARILGEDYGVEGDNLDEVVRKLDALLGSPAFKDLTGMDIASCISGLPEGIFSDSVVNAVVMGIYPAVLDGLEEQLLVLPMSPPNSCTATQSACSVKGATKELCGNCWGGEGLDINACIGALAAGSATFANGSPTTDLSRYNLKSLHDILDSDGLTVGTAGTTVLEPKASVHQLRLYPDLLHKYLKGTATTPTSLIYQQYADTNAFLAQVTPQNTSKLWQDYGPFGGDFVGTKPWTDPVILEGGSLKVDWGIDREPSAFLPIPNPSYDPQEYLPDGVTPNPGYDPNKFMLNPGYDPDEFEADGVTPNPGYDPEKYLLSTTPDQLYGMTKRQRFYSAMAAAFDGVWPLLEAMFCGRDISLSHPQIAEITVHVYGRITDPVSGEVNVDAYINQLELGLAVDEGTPGYGWILTPFFESVLGANANATGDLAALYGMLPDLLTLAGFTEGMDLVAAIFDPLLAYFDSLGQAPLGSLLELLPNLAYVMMFDRINYALDKLEVDLDVIPNGFVTKSVTSPTATYGGTIASTVDGIIDDELNKFNEWSIRGFASGSKADNPIPPGEFSVVNVGDTMNVPDLVGYDCFTCLKYPDTTCACLVDPNGCVGCFVGGCMPGGLPCLPIGEMVLYGEMDEFATKRPEDETYTYVAEYGTWTYPDGTYHYDPVHGTEYLDTGAWGYMTDILRDESQPMVQMLDGSGNPVPQVQAEDGAGNPLWWAQAVDENDDPLYWEQEFDGTDFLFWNQKCDASSNPLYWEQLVVLGNPMYWTDDSETTMSSVVTEWPVLIEDPSGSGDPVMEKTNVPSADPVFTGETTTTPNAYPIISDMVTTDVYDPIVDNPPVMVDVFVYPPLWVYDDGTGTEPPQIDIDPFTDLPFNSYVLTPIANTYTENALKKFEKTPVAGPSPAVGYHINADKGDMLLFLLRYLFQPEAIGAVGGLVDSLVDNPSIQPILSTVLANIESHPDDAIAALVELMFPRDPQYSVGYVQYGDPELADAKFPEWWAGRLGLTSPTGEEKAEWDANYIIDNADVLLDVLFDAVFGQSFTDLTAHLLGELADMTANPDEIYDFLEALILDLLDDPDVMAVLGEYSPIIKQLVIINGEPVDIAIPNPAYDPDEYLPNPLYDPDEFLANPAYDPDEFLANPAYDPDEFLADGVTPNPAYDPDEYLLNPAYDPDEFLADGVTPNPAYDPNEYLLNPAYDPDEFLSNPAYDPDEFLPNVLNAVDQLINFLLCGGELEILDIDRDPGAVTPAPEGFVKVLGYKGYELAIVPLLKIFTDPLGVSNLLADQAAFDAADLKGKLRLITTPLLAVVEAIVTNPVEALLELLPNMVYFLVPDEDGNDSPLQQAIDKLLKPLYVLVDTVRPIVDLQALIVGDGTLDELINGLLDTLDIADRLADLDLGDDLTALLETVLENLSLASLGIGFDLNDGGLRVDMVVLCDFIGALIPDVLAALGLELPFEINLNILDFLVGTIETDSNVIPSNYLKADKAAVLFALLDNLGLLDLIWDMDLVGLTQLIQYGKFPNAEKVDYAMAPPAATVAAPPAWFDKTKHAQFLVENADAVLAVAWDRLIAGNPQMKGFLGGVIDDLLVSAGLGSGFIVGDSLGDTVDEFFGNETYTVGGLLMLANLLYGLKDTLDEFLYLDIGDNITLDLADLLSKLVWIYDDTGAITPLDLGAIFDHVADFIDDLENGVTVIADEDDFKSALADLCAPLVPLLRVFLSESNIMFIRDPRIVDTQTDPVIDPYYVGHSIADEGFLRVYGYNGYESGLLTILLGIGADVPGFIGLVEPYASFKGMSEEDQLLAVLDPILYLLHALADNPVQTLLQVLPNVAYLIGDGANAGDVPLLTQAIRNIIHPLTVLLDLLPADLAATVNDMLSPVTDMSLGSSLNAKIADMLAGVDWINAFEIESLVVGKIEMLGLGFNAIGKNNQGSYVDADMADLLIQILSVTGLFDLVEDYSLQGLIELLNYPDRVPVPADKVDYTMAPPAATVATPPAWFNKTNHAEFLVENADGVIAWAFEHAIAGNDEMKGYLGKLIGDLIGGADLSDLIGDSLPETLDGFFGNEAYTVEGLLMLANLLYSLKDVLDDLLLTVDDFMYDSLGVTFDLKDLLSKSVFILNQVTGVSTGLDIDAIFDHVADFIDDLENGVTVIADEDDFKNALADLCAPLMPLLGVFLNGSDILAIKDPRIDAPDEALLRVFGSNGYESGLLTILLGIGADVPGFIDIVEPYSTFQTMSEEDQLLAILDPILFLLHALADNPVQTLLQVLPNVAYLIGDGANAGDIPLVIQALRNILHPIIVLLDLVTIDMLEPVKDIVSQAMDLKLGSLLNELIADSLANVEFINAFEIESLVVGVIDLLGNGFNTIGKDDGGSYVDVDLADLLIQLLSVTGLFDLIEDTGFQGLIELLNYPGREPLPINPVDYANVSSANPYQGWMWVRRDAMSMLDKLPGLVDDVLGMLMGDTLESMLRNAVGDSLFTQQNFDSIVGALQNLLNGFDLNIVIIPGENEGDPPVLTVGDLLDGIVKIGDREIDVLAVLEALKTWTPGGPVTDQASFISELIDFLLPAVPLLDWLLFGEDIVILSGEIRINGTNGLLKAFGFEGYQYGLIPILEALLLPLGAESIIATPADMKTKSDADKLRAILDPILYAVEVVIDNPLEGLLNLLPNVAYFVSVKNDNGRTALEESLNNVLFAATSLFGAVTGEPMDANGLIGLLTGDPNFKLDIPALLDDLLEGATATKKDANGKPENGIKGIGTLLLKSVIIGSVQGYDSLSGLRGTFIMLRTQEHRADLLTAILRAIFELVQENKGNREAIVTMLTNLLIPEGQFGNTALHWGIHFILWVSRLLGKQLSFEILQKLVLCLTWFMPVIRWFVGIIKGISG